MRTIYFNTVSVKNIPGGHRSSEQFVYKDRNCKAKHHMQGMQGRVMCEVLIKLHTKVKIIDLRLKDVTVSPRGHLFYVDFLFFIFTSHRGGNVSTAVRAFPPR